MNRQKRSSRYRNAWLRIQTAGARVQITASQSSAPGTAKPDTEIDLALTLTGMVDLSHNIYYGKRAQLLELTPAAS